MIVTEGPENPAGQGVESFDVPDGFSYENSSNSTINISFERDDVEVYFDLINGSAEDGGNVLVSDKFTGSFSTELLIPNHIDKISVLAGYKNVIKLFTVDRSDNMILSMTEADFVPTFNVPDPTARSVRGAARTQKKDDCLPSELGVYFPEDIKDYDQYLVAYTDVYIKEIVVHYADGSKVKDKDPVADYDDYWVIEIDLDQKIQGAWVTVTCKKDGGGKKYEEYISNPHYSASTDTDEDGVEDGQDIAPEDPTIAKVSYEPAQDEYTTMAFEDLWPYKGDFDFNDFVIAHNKTIYLDASDMVSKIVYQFKVKAIGASFSNDFCFHVSDKDHTAEVSIATQSDVPHEVVDLDGKTEVRFPGIKDAYGSVGFVNTQDGKDTLQELRFTASIVLDRTISLSDFVTDEYLRINEEVGREVHLPNVPFTSLADESMFNTGHDDTDAASGRYYLTQNNLPWAIEIPIDWAYPKEGREISSAYKNFQKYAESEPNLVWYTMTEENTDSEQIYLK